MATTSFLSSVSMETVGLALVQIHDAAFRNKDESGNIYAEEDVETTTSSDDRFFQVWISSLKQGCCRMCFSRIKI